MLQNRESVGHDGVLKDFAVTNGVEVDCHPLYVIACAGAPKEFAAMGPTEAIEHYDLVAFRENVEHFGSSILDRLIERLIELSARANSSLGARKRKG